MDLLKNPFHILGATTRDNRHKIIELEEERSLLSDTDECMEARSILIHPRRRISAEVAWLPGVDPDLVDRVLRQLDITSGRTISPLSNFIDRELPPIARANLLASKLLRERQRLNSDYIMEWILAIAQSSEAIKTEWVCATLNTDREVSGFPEITDLSTVDDEVQKQRDFYSRTVTSVLESWSVNERANVMTLLLETSTSNGRYQPSTLIKDLIPGYEGSVQNSLEQHKNIIEAQDAKLRAMVTAQNPDTTLTSIVDQILGALREWDRLVQPIQLSQRSTGERHNASFEMALRFRRLAADLFHEHRKSDLAKKILNTLKDIFAEAPEITEEITTDLRELEKQILFLRSVEKIEEIQSQVEKLKVASDAYKPDYTLAPMVRQLIQNVKTWNTTTQPVEANNAVAIMVRNIALHLWNEHQKLDFAIQITNALIGVFKGAYGMAEVNKRLNEDIITLYAMDRQRKQATEQQQQSSNDGSRDKIIGYAIMGVIFLILALIGALSEGC